MRPPYADRHRIEAAVVVRLENNYRLSQIEALPGMPSRQTLYRWARERPSFAQQMATARACGRGLARGGRDAFDDRHAEAFLAQVRARAAVRDLVKRPEWPDRERLNAWKAARPEFAAALVEATAAARKGRLPRVTPYDEATADRIVLRLHKGETMPELLRDPGLPGRAAIRQWRRRVPEFDGAVKRAQHVGQLTRMRRTSKYTPQLIARVVEAIELGHSLHSLAQEPGMPHHVTLYGWIRTKPAFAEAVAGACEIREHFLCDQAVARLDGMPPEALEAWLEQVGGVPRRVSTMPNWPGRRRG